MSAQLSNSEARVIRAAAKWRTVYHAWLTADAATATERDLSQNGENLALSKLLDALQALDQERERLTAAAVPPREGHDAAQ